MAAKEQKTLKIAWLTPDQEASQTLSEVVGKDTKLKKWLVDYVGKQKQPTNGDVTVEMIVETVAEEFPEFLLSVAEENWARGYEQGLDDAYSLEENEQN